MKSAAFDSRLGGRDIDWAIAQHCADEFQAKTGKVRLSFVFLGIIPSSLVIAILLGDSAW